MKFEISRQILEKYQNFNFHENPSSGSGVVPCGRTDRHDEVVTFPNLVNAPNKKIYKVENISDSNSLFIVLSVTLQPPQIIQN
jgi:hypothetical protein